MIDNLGEAFTLNMCLHVLVAQWSGILFFNLFSTMFFYRFSMFKSSNLFVLIKILELFKNKNVNLSTLVLRQPLIANVYSVHLKTCSPQLPLSGEFFSSCAAFLGSVNHLSCFTQEMSVFQKQGMLLL